MRVREVGAEGGQIVPGRAEVVVHDVEDHTQAQFMGPVDEAFQRLGAAVRFVHGPQRDALVAPAVSPGEGAQGHQLDVGDAQFDEMPEPLGSRVQRALTRVRAHVQLVQHRTGQWPPGPLGTPLVAAVVDDRTEPVRAVRLPARTRIGQHRPVVQREPVPRPVPRLGLPHHHPARSGSRSNARVAPSQWSVTRPACGAHTSNCTDGSPSSAHRDVARPWCFKRDQSAFESSLLRRGVVAGLGDHARVVAVSPFSGHRGATDRQSAA